MSLQDFAKQIQKVRKEAQDQGRQLIKQEANTLFEKFPDLQYICWTQYTPYFNDGDTCVFRFHGAQAYAANIPTEPVALYQEQDYRELENKCNLGQYFKEPFDANLNTAVKEFSKSLDNLGDILQDALGDHCYVVVTRNAIRVDEYEHD